MEWSILLRRIIRGCMYLVSLCILLSLLAGPQDLLLIFCPAQAFLLASYIYVAWRGAHPHQSHQPRRWSLGAGGPLSKMVLSFLLLIIVLFALAQAFHWSLDIFLVVCLIVGILLFAHYRANQGRPKRGRTKRAAPGPRGIPVAPVREVPYYIPSLPAQSEDIAPPLAYGSELPSYQSGYGPRSTAFPHSESGYAFRDDDYFSGSTPQYEEPLAQYPEAPPPDEQ